MKELAYVKEFVFDEAHYYVSDGQGDAALLRVNYKSNSYQVENKGSVVNKVFRQELHQIVSDLLRRKHGVNFAATLRKT